MGNPGQQPNRPSNPQSVRVPVEPYLEPELDDPRESAQNLTASGLGLLGAAAVVGVIGWWLLRAGTSEQANPVSRRPGERAEARLLAEFLGFGGLAVLVGGVLVVLAIMSFYKAARKRRRG